MKISDSVYSLRIPFRIPAGGGLILERSVNAFMISTSNLTLVDAGVAESTGSILSMVRDAGRDPGEVSTLVLTHSHPDHIGGARAIQKATDCIVAAHPAERAWIEDTDLQARERPIPGFSTLVEGPVRIDRLLADGDRIDIGGGRSLAVIHTPGHSPGSISLFLEEEGVLYLRRCDPRKRGDPGVRRSFRVHQIHREAGGAPGSEGPPPLVGRPEEGRRRYVRRWRMGRRPSTPFKKPWSRSAKKDPDPGSVTREVVETLGLPEAALPVISRTVAGHLRGHGREQGLIRDDRRSRERGYFPGPLHSLVSSSPAPPACSRW